MKVFITWSGERSKTIAEALRKWLPNVIQSITPWMSVTDIRAGGRWQSELNQQLEQTDFGIIVLTPENLAAPWIHYEAGALAKKIDIGGVCPYLVDIPEKTTVTGPLAHFQSKLADKKETFELLKEINQRIKEETGKLDDVRLNDSFELYWPRLKEVIDTPSVVPIQTKERTDSDLLKEILLVVRSIEQQITRDLTIRRLDEIMNESFESTAVNPEIPLLIRRMAPEVIPLGLARAAAVLRLSEDKTKK